VYVGFEDGSMQLIEFLDPDSAPHPLYDSQLQTTPVQVTSPPWTTPKDAGPALCVGLSYDGTCLLSGHASGKIAQWDTGRRMFSAELTDLNAPVTNLLMLTPFPENRLTTSVTVVKPKLGDSSYTFVARLTGSTRTSSYYRTLQSPGFSHELLEDVITRFSAPVASSSSGDDQLRRENEELWKVIHEQRDLQKKTWEKYTQLKGNAT